MILKQNQGRSPHEFRPSISQSSQSRSGPPFYDAGRLVGSSIRPDFRKTSYADLERSIDSPGRRVRHRKGR